MNVEKVSVHADGRGMVFEPALPDDLAGQRNVHVVVTRPGGIRGNHLHTRGTEIIVVVGEALFRYREDDRLVDHPVPAGEAHRFRVPAGVAHAIQNTGDRDNILIGFSTEEHDKANPDTVPAAIL